MPSAFSHDPSITVPGSSTDNAIAIFDSTGGSGFGNSTILVDSGGNGRIGIAGDTDVIIVTANTVTVAGTVAATTLTGNGAGVTALAAGNIASGTVATARLGSGTANNTVFLRGDGTWAAAGSPGGSNTHVQYQSGGGFAGSANLIFDGTDTLTLSSTSTPELVINAPSGSNGVNMVMSCASGTTGSLLTRYKEGAANGTTNNMAYFLGYETGSNVFSLRSLNSDGSQTSAVVWKCQDGTGAITKPLQPSFIAKLTTTQNNVMGGSGGGALLDGRWANSNWSIEEERGECFNNGTFTAPVNGLYYVTYIISLGGLTSANTYMNLWLDTDTALANIPITSEHGFNGSYESSGERYIRWSSLLEFDANDTAYLSGHTYYGSQVVDVQIHTTFSAILVA